MFNLTGSSAETISKLYPPRRNDQGENYFIWYGSHILCRYEHFKWTLIECFENGDTIWQNPQNLNQTGKVNNDGGIHYIYLNKIKPGDVVEWRDVPDQSIVLNDPNNYGGWHIFGKVNGRCCSIAHSPEELFQNMWQSFQPWSSKITRAETVTIIATNLRGDETGEELKKLFQEFQNRK